jgi:hypothetical protein
MAKQTCRHRVGLGRPLVHRHSDTVIQLLVDSSLTRFSDTPPKRFDALLAHR